MNILSLLVIIFSLCMHLTVHSAFSLADLRNFQSLTGGELSLTEVTNLSSRSVSYFKGNPATAWPEQNTSEEVALAPYLATINSVVTSTTTTLSFSLSTASLPSNASGQLIFTSLSQLLTSLTGSLSTVPASIEVLPDVQTLLSNINTGLISQQQQYGLQPSYTVNFSNSGLSTFPTVEQLISSYLGFPNTSASGLAYTTYMDLYDYTPNMTNALENVFGETFIGLTVKLAGLTKNTNNRYVFNNLSDFLGALVLPGAGGTRTGTLPTVSTQALTEPSMGTFFSNFLSTDFQLFQSFRGLQNYSLAQMPSYTILFDETQYNQASNTFNPVAGQQPFTRPTYMYRGWTVENPFVAGQQINYMRSNH